MWPNDSEQTGKKFLLTLTPELEGGRVTARPQWSVVAEANAEIVLRSALTGRELHENGGSIVWQWKDGKLVLLPGKFCGDDKICFFPISQFRAGIYLKYFPLGANSPGIWLLSYLFNPDNLVDKAGGWPLDWQRSVVPRSYLWVQGPADSNPSPDSRRITLALIKYQGHSDTSLKPQLVENAEDQSVVLKHLFSGSALVWAPFSGPTQPYSWRRLGTFEIYRDKSDAQLDAIMRYFGDNEERIFEPVDFPSYDSSRDKFFAHPRSNESEQHQIDHAIASIEKKMQEHYEALQRAYGSSPRSRLYDNYLRGYETFGLDLPEIRRSLYRGR